MRRGRYSPLRSALSRLCACLALLAWALETGALVLLHVSRCALLLFKLLLLLPQALGAGALETGYKHRVRVSLRAVT